MSKHAQKERSYFHLGKTDARKGITREVPKRFEPPYNLGREHAEQQSVGEFKRAQKQQRQQSYIKSPMTPNSPYLND